MEGESRKTIGMSGVASAGIKNGREIRARLLWPEEENQALADAVPLLLRDALFTASAVAVVAAFMEASAKSVTCLAALVRLSTAAAVA